MKLILSITIVLILVSCTSDSKVNQKDNGTVLARAYFEGGLPEEFYKKVITIETDINYSKHILIGFYQIKNQNRWMFRIKVDFDKKYETYKSLVRTKWLNQVEARRIDELYNELKDLDFVKLTEKFPGMVECTLMSENTLKELSTNLNTLTEFEPLFEALVADIDNYMRFDFLIPIESGSGTSKRVFLNIDKLYRWGFFDLTPDSTEFVLTR